MYRTNSAQTPPPDAETAARLISQCPDIHSSASAYNLNTWIKRAEYFLTLNHPELAASDAYKSLLLIERDYNDPENGETSDKIRKANDILSQALYDCHCHAELQELRESLAPEAYSSDKFAGINELLSRKEDAAGQLGGTPHEIRDRIRDGGVLTVYYPWIHERHFTRTQSLINLVNEELETSSEGPKCYWARSTLASDGDNMGMFAAQDLRKGDIILVNRTATATCSTPASAGCDNCYGPASGSWVEAPCCDVKYCSLECHDLALNTYHKVLCGQDFSWLQNPAKGLTFNASPLRPLLMLRVLATCIQSGADRHSLDHPLIARLQPLSDGSHLDVFTFTESILTPIRILEQLHVDMFGVTHFDTMVLHTIWIRLANNKAGSPDPKRGFIDVISPHLPLFNHSCEPNVEWKRRDGSSTISFAAKRDVERGAELFSSYVDVRRMGLEERTRVLWPWFEGLCLCAKCKRERAAVEA